MRQGQRLARPTLDQIRERHRGERERMPARLFSLDDPVAYPVILSDQLQAIQRQTTNEVRSRELGI